MSEHADRLAHDEEADTQSVAPCMIQTSESVEDFRHCFLRDAAACVEYVDADVLIGLTAAYENSATRLCVFDGVADYIAKNSTKKQSIAYDVRACRNHSDFDALLQGGLFVLVADLPQQRLEANRR